MRREREVRIRAVVYDGGAYHIEVVEGAQVRFSMHAEREPAEGAPERKLVQQAVLRGIGLAK